MNESDRVRRPTPPAARLETWRWGPCAADPVRAESCGSFRERWRHSIPARVREEFQATFKVLLGHVQRRNDSHYIVEDAGPYDE
jgi:hypothetical protein